MKVKFKSFKVVSDYSGSYDSYVELTLNFIIKKLISIYKEKRDLNKYCESLIEVEKFDEKVMYLPENCKYAWIYERHRSTPHGSFSEYKFISRGTSEDFMFKKSINFIKDMVKK